MTDTKERRTYSQQTAAEKLGIHRNTLGIWRREGKVRPDVIVSEPAADLGVPQPNTIVYDADLIDAIAKGEQKLAVEPAEAKAP